MPFFESRLACFSFRFSFSDLPTFFELCWLGDFSATGTPQLGDVNLGGAEIVFQVHLDKAVGPESAALFVVISPPTLTTRHLALTFHARRHHTTGPRLPTP
jgi:hypothetical protein